MSNDSPIQAAFKFITSSKRKLENLVENQTANITAVAQMVNDEKLPAEYVPFATEVASTIDSLTEGAFASMQAALERLVEARAHLDLAMSQMSQIAQNEAQCESLIKVINKGEQEQ